MEALFPLLFVLFIGIAIVASIYAKKAAEKRRADLLVLSTQLGFQMMPGGLTGPTPTNFWGSVAQAFSESPDSVFLQRFQGFSPFGQGHSPDIENLLVGQKDGLDWYLFDYTYKVTTSNGKTTTTTTHPFGVVAVRVPLSLPSLSLTPENVFHRIGSKLGVHELTFELEEFNRRYFIRGDDARLAHDLLHPRAIDYLMAQPIRTWQMGGMYLLVHKPGFFEPLEFGHVVEEIRGFLALIPDYVRQDRGFTPKWSSPLD